MVLGSLIICRYKGCLLSQTRFVHLLITPHHAIVMALDAVSVAHYYAAILGSQVNGIMLLLHLTLHFYFFVCSTYDAKINYFH